MSVSLDSTLDRILQEVSAQVFSSEDLLPTTSSTHFTSEDQFEQRYQEHGTLFLEKLEHHEWIISLRKICEKSTEMLGIIPSFHTDIAVALFGLGECGEKSALLGMKMGLGGIRHMQIYCHNEPYVQTAGKSVQQCHRLVLMQVKPRKLRAVSRAHSFLAALELSSGLAIDPFFRFRCPVSQLSKQTALVDYLALHKISRIDPQYCIETADNVKEEALLCQQNAHQIYKLAKKLLMQEPNFPFQLNTRGAFIAQKKCALAIQVMQRHFSSFQWAADLELRDICTYDKKEEIQALENQLTSYGFTISTEARRGRNRTVYQTLALKNPPISALYTLEVQSAIPPLAPGIAASIVNYLTSPFKGLCLNAFLKT